MKAARKDMLEDLFSHGHTLNLQLRGEVRKSLSGSDKKWNTMMEGLKEHLTRAEDQKKNEYGTAATKDI